FSAHTAVLIEAHGARAALAGNVPIARLAVGAGNGVGFAQGAFDIGPCHAGAYLLFHDGSAPCLLAQQVATTIILLADHGQFGLRLLWLLILPLSDRGRFRHSRGLARAGRGVERILYLGALAWRTALSSERHVPVRVNAAVNAGGVGVECEEEQGA